jgi:prepilin-type N-terminal cleavage/methylation domain-containing protein
MRGFTIVELVVVLLLLGLLATGATLTVGMKPAGEADPSAWTLLRARARAAGLAVAETLTVGRAHVAVLPDGRLLTAQLSDSGRRDAAR